MCRGSGGDGRGSLVIRFGDEARSGDEVAGLHLRQHLINEVSVSRISSGDVQ